MQQASSDAGAEFIVMFLPFKSQVYWRLLERSLTPDDLHRALSIRFFDTTAALERRVESGENPYFPDDSHLNEVGHAIVAGTLARFLDK